MIFHYSKWSYVSVLPQIQIEYHDVVSQMFQNSDRHLELFGELIKTDHE